MSLSGQTASGHSSGFSLRERLRLEAQERLASQSASLRHDGNGASQSSAAHAGSDANSSDDDDVPLPALTLAGRPQREAARNRPSTYAIDPVNESTRLSQHPHARASLRIPPGLKQSSDDVLRLLREKSRRSARGTDQDGYSRAEAIAINMERDRLQKMGIAPEATTLSSSSSTPSQNVGFPNTQSKTLTVRALSPAIPSYTWSSQSDPDDEDDDVSGSQTSSSSVFSTDADTRIAASLLATSTDPTHAQATVNLLRKDTLQQHADRRTSALSGNEGRVPYWTDGRTSRPSVYEFCKAPVPGHTAEDVVADSDADVSDGWDETAVHILLAGSVPPSLELGPVQIQRLMVWSALTYVFADDTETTHLSLALFHNLIVDAERSNSSDRIPQAMYDLLLQVPAVLKRLGVRGDVLQTCFPDHLEALDTERPVASRSGKKRKRRANGRMSRRFMMHLTLSERDEILISLCRMICAVLPHAVVNKQVSLLAGIATSLSVAAASTTNLELQREIGHCVQDLFALALSPSNTLALQNWFCERLLDVSSGLGLCLQARLVLTLTGEGIQLQSVRRWIAWSVLVKHHDSAESIGTFEPWSLDLLRLEQAEDPTDPSSPFFISSIEDSVSGRPQTDYHVLMAATQLLAVALHDLPVHLCTFDPPSTPLPLPQPPAAVASEGGKPPRRTTTALSLAMTPYKSLQPSLDPSRVNTLHRITAALGVVGNKIRENKGDIFLRSLAKDLLQRIAHSIEYQLLLFDPASAHRDHRK